MNVRNNKRRLASREKIERVFVELLQTKELAQITVSEICKLTGLNRTTFYANYADIYDLADRIRDRLEGEVSALYESDIANHFNSNDYLRLFRHIRENQLFYKTYFKLGYDSQHHVNLYDLEQANRFFSDQHIEYHIDFFKAGFNAMVNRWLEGGCKESPEEMNQILMDEYQGRNMA